MTLRPHPESACGKNHAPRDRLWPAEGSAALSADHCFGLFVFSSLLWSCVSHRCKARWVPRSRPSPSSRGRTFVRRSSHGRLFLATPRGANNPPKRSGSHSRRRRRSCLGRAVCRSCMGGRRPDKDACEQISRDPIACIKTKAKRFLDQHAQPRGWVSHRRKAQQQGCRCKVGSTTVMLTDNSNPLMQNRPARCHFLWWKSC